MRSIERRSSEFGGSLRSLLVVWFAIELVDELVFGVQDSALPLIRSDLHLGYAAVGLLLSAPALVANLIEIPIGLLADSPLRHQLVLGGGIMFTIGVLTIAAAPSFAVLIVAMSVLYPASGAFVALSQADLMDADVNRRDQNMARWNLAGSIGALAGPGLLIAVVFVDASWRGAYVAMGFVAATALVGLAIAPRAPHPSEAQSGGLIAAVRAALRSLRRGEVLRALLMLEISQLMLDVLTGYLALYFVDVLRQPGWVGALVIGVRISAGIAGDVLTGASARTHRRPHVRAHDGRRCPRGFSVVASRSRLAAQAHRAGRAERAHGRLVPGATGAPLRRAAGTKRGAARDRKCVPHRSHTDPTVHRSCCCALRTRQRVVDLRNRTGAAQPAASTRPHTT
jgi:MFS family permease